MTSPLDLAREMIELAKKATPEPWIWHTSNSWRRLRGGSRDEHRVAEPVIQHPDNHPDILATDADKAFIARSRSIAPALAAAVVELTERDELAISVIVAMLSAVRGHLPEGFRSVRDWATKAAAKPANPQILTEARSILAALDLLDGRDAKARAALSGKPQTQGEAG